MELAKIVVQYADGRVIKGYTQNFSPNKPTFQIYQRYPEFLNEPIEVVVKDLKRIFFVRDFWEKRNHNGQKVFLNGSKLPGKKVEVTFKDREVMKGSVLGYESQRSGFFFFPDEPCSNNIKVFAVSQAVGQLSYL